MDAAEQWEPDEARASRPVLRARGGEIPPRDSPHRRLRVRERRPAILGCDARAIGGILVRALPSNTQGGGECLNSARPDLRGGRSEMSVPCTLPTA
jgi:hypothetical protein